MNLLDFFCTHDNTGHYLTFKRVKAVASEHSEGNEFYKG